MSICKCDSPYSNVGFVGCPTKKQPALIMLVPLLGSDGTENRVDTQDAGYIADKKQYFIDKYNAADPLDRFYPLAIKNGTSERSASTFESNDDGTKNYVRQGTRNFSYNVIKGTPQLLGRIKSWACANGFGIYIVDVEGNDNGIIKDDSNRYLYPFPVDTNSFDPNQIWASGDITQKTVIAGEFDASFNDEDERMIPAADLLPANLRTLYTKGLQDVYATYSAISTTSFKAALYTKDGSITSPILVPGLVAADFALYNVNDSASVTILTAPESPDGTYTLTFAAQTSADKLRLTPTKERFDFTEVTASLVTIP